MRGSTPDRGLWWRIHLASAGAASGTEAHASRIGVVAMVGGKNKTRIRNATPLVFRDLLLCIAKTARPSNLLEAA